MTLKEQLDVLPIDQHIVIHYNGIEIFSGEMSDIPKAFEYETITNLKVLVTTAIDNYIFIRVKK